MKPNRHSIRLKGYDYSAEGAYFVTMVCKDRLHWFGEVTDGKMQLSEAGNIVEEEWLRGAELRSEITLDAYVVMPNHFHGIVVIGEPLIPLEAIRCRAFATRGNDENHGRVANVPERVFTMKLFNYDNRKIMFSKPQKIILRQFLILIRVIVTFH